jgi:hypothetical protein
MRASRWGKFSLSAGWATTARWVGQFLMKSHAAKLPGIGKNQRGLFGKERDDHEGGL